MFLKIFRRFSQSKKIAIRLVVHGKETTQQIQTGYRLAKCLEELKVPLEFECGFACSCATCLINLEQEDYKKMEVKCPMASIEKTMIESKNLSSDGRRLSCQLKVDKDFEGLKVIIQ